MPDDGMNPKRRRFLTAATGTVGGVGLAAVAWPFLTSMQPSERAQAAGAPVEVNIGKIEPGQLILQEWRGKPVWILRRSQKMLDSLDKVATQLRDPKSAVASQQPEFARNKYRSLKPEYLVLVGICTHLGCSPTFMPKPGAGGMGGDWPGGFFCPCHGSRFDLAGRVFKNVPAPINLEVPPYKYLSDTRILVGASADDSANGGAV